MFDRVYTNIINPPDRLMTEMYKDQRESDKRKYDWLDKLLNSPTFDQIKTRLYKMKGNNVILKGEWISRADIEWYLDYKQKWNY